MTASPGNGIRPRSNPGEEDDSGGGHAGAGDEDGAEQGEEVHAETAEAPPIKVACSPCSPTAKEREEHNCTHCPYRNWRPVCVEAKGKEDGHDAGKEEGPREKPTVGLDYKAFGEDADQEDKSMAIIMRDRETKMTFAHVCPCKGPDPWVIARVADDIDTIGHADIIMKSDGEPALVKLMMEIKAKRAHSTIPQHPPAYDPQSNGAIEKAVDDVMGQVRALKIGLERRIKERIGARWPILHWIVEHACTVINRCQVGHDGMTPYRRLVGKDSPQRFLEIGESVLAKPKRKPESNRKRALRSKWVHGTWVGMTQRTNEHLVVLAQGGPAVRVRTVKRKPLEDRWDADAVREVKATPYKPNPKDQSQAEVHDASRGQGDEVLPVIEVRGDGTQLEEAEVEEREVRRRDFKITKRILEKYGYDPDCPGCTGALTGKRREHTLKCRVRLEEKMNDDVVDVRRLLMRDERVAGSTGGAGGPPKEQAVQGEVEEGEPTAPVVVPSVSEPGVSTTSTSSSSSSSSAMPNAARTSDEGVDAGGIPDLLESDDESGGGPKLEEEVGRKRNQREDEAEEISGKKRRLQLVGRLKSIIMGKVERRVGFVSKNFEVQKFAEQLYENEETSQHTPEKVKELEQRNITQVMQAIMKLERDSPHDDAEEERLRFERMYADVEFADDVHDGKMLKKELVIKARQLELEFFRKMGVYEKVPKSEARGQTIVSTRWVDTNKGDDEHEDYRSRLVGREIKTNVRPDLFAATPPLETIKLLIERCAQGQNRTRPLRIGIVDVRRAYFYAEASREVYISIPEEDRLPGDENKVGRLRLSLYGTRDAAQNWQREYTRFLISLGFRRGRASPCNFWHEARDITLTCHGDDFFIVASDEELEWIITQLKRKYEIKSQKLGPRKEDLKEIRFLNRTVRWKREGIEYEPDQRHSDLLVRDLGLEGAKPLSTPGTAELENEDEDVNDKTDDKDDNRFRRLAARLNYLSLDRADLQVASKSVSRYMSSPTAKAWRLIKRVGRYLVGAGRFVQQFPWGSPTTLVQAYADSDWAGNKHDGSSTSGGVLKWGSGTLKTWASSQRTVALSSGEAELYAVTNATSQMLGLISMLEGFGIFAKGEVYTDSTAALGMVSREGLGRTRHIRIRYLWMQGVVQEGAVKVKKVDTLDNVADLLTKHMCKERRECLLEKMHMKVNSTRAEGALRISQVTGASDRWLVRGGPQEQGLQHDRVGAEDLKVKKLEGKGFAIPERKAAVILKELESERRTWIRLHAKVRRARFTPLMVKDGPVHQRDVGDYRVDVMRKRGKDEYVVTVSRWKLLGASHEPIAPSFGISAFTWRLPESVVQLALDGVQLRGGKGIQVYR